jgi:hypothetical protein
MLWRIVRKSRRRLHLSGHLFTVSSVYTVGRARVGGGATLIQVGAHTPPPPPPHRKSGVPDLRDEERISGRPEMRRRAGLGQARDPWAGEQVGAYRKPLRPLAALHLSRPARGGKSRLAHPNVVLAHHA